MAKTQDPQNTATVEPEVSLKLTSIVLIAVTGLCFVLWFAILTPFLSVLAWALTLSIITLPFHERLENIIKNKTICASLSVAFIALVITGPAIFTFRELIIAGSENAQMLNLELEKSGGLENFVSRSLPKDMARWVDHTFGIKQSIQDLSTMAAAQSPVLLSGSVWIVIQLLLVLFTCFFFLRDKDLFMRKIGNYMPLSKPEYRTLFLDIRDTIQATVFGNIVTSCIQGALGGLMFWILDLPASVLWGLVMAFLSLLPTLGAPVIWIPASVILAAQGNYENAIILALWGTFVVGLIDNVLYPILVGKRVRLHTLAVFFFILGGIIFFGTSGLVLGPMALAVGQSLLKIWKARLS